MLIPQSMEQKLISWNVNGLRAALKKDAFAFLDAENPDILCLQETKLQEGQIEPILDQYPNQYWNYAVKKGYSGTAVFSRHEPLSVSRGMGSEEHDQEGRLLTLEFPHFYLVNVYTPNAQRGLARLDYRMRWDRDFRSYLSRLDKDRPVVLCGDLNVAHQEIDLANPDANHKNAGFSDEERRGFSELISAGFLDSFREFNSEGGHYTWWTYMFKARENNIGWRIDYFCVSRRLRPALKDAFIRSEVMGSDHCPVGIILSV
jgi:exodeoxyribonuclease-3